MDQPRYCPKCHAVLSDQAGFCPRCGLDLTDVQFTPFPRRRRPRWGGLIWLLVLLWILFSRFSGHRPMALPAPRVDQNFFQPNR